jgi:hypothetical protein
MKKLLILISFLFVTVCYAAPPPDDGNLLVYETEMISAYDVTETVDVAVYTMQRIEAQEVAYSYIGNPELFTGTANNYNEFTATLLFAELPELNNQKLSALNRPPSFALSDVGVKMLVAIDKQHTNYGYPLTADRYRREKSRLLHY